MTDLLQFFAAARSPRGQEICECCEGSGSHGSQGTCIRCTGTGFTGAGSDEPWCPSRSDDQPAPPRRHWRQPRTAAKQVRSEVPFTVAPEHPLPRDFLDAYDNDHFKDGHQFTAAMPRPDYDTFAEMPEGRGLWYRAHDMRYPLDHQHARSAPLSHGYKPFMKQPAFSTGQRGYSAFASPHQLSSYMDEMEWKDHPSWKHRSIVGFHGKEVGRGEDGEPLVVPEANPHCCGKVIHSSTPPEEFEKKIWHGDYADEESHKYHNSDQLWRDKRNAGEPTGRLPNVIDWRSPEKKSERRQWEKQDDARSRRTFQAARQREPKTAAHERMHVEDLLDLHSDEALFHERNWTGNQHAGHSDATRVRTMYDAKAEEMDQNPEEWHKLDKPIRNGTIDPVLLAKASSGHTVVSEGGHRIIRAHQLGVSHLPVSWDPGSQAHRGDWDDPFGQHDAARHVAVSLDELDHHLENWFHPQKLEADQERQPPDDQPQPGRRHWREPKTAAIRKVPPAEYNEALRPYRRGLEALERENRHLGAREGEEPSVEHSVTPSGGSQYPHMHTLRATHPDGTTAELRYMMSKRQT